MSDAPLPSLRARLSPHQVRPIRFLELVVRAGWQFKLYGISEHNEFPDLRLQHTAKTLAAQVLPQPPETAHRYGLAFVTLHEATAFNQITIDWWAHENELRHRVFKAQPEDPLHFVDITSTGEAFCVWELRVLAFERAAWLATMLTDARPQPQTYLAEQLDEDA